MKRLFIFWMVAAMGGMLEAKVDLVTLPWRDTVQLTIYNSADMTLVRESRGLTLKEGKNSLQFSWANTLIDPTSLEMLPKAHADKIDIAELTYPARVQNLGLWNIDSKVSGKVPVEITYLTSGLSWRAFYMGTLTEDEKAMRLEGYVRVTNNSGEDYENAQTRLIVGVVHILDEIADLARKKYPYGRPAAIIRRDYDESRLATSAEGSGFAAGVERMAEAAARPKEIRKEGLSEYFLYTIEGTETIPTGWSKRLLSFDKDEVPVVNLYKYEEERYGNSVVRFLSFKNDEKHKLGETPIPGGVLKVYRSIDKDGHLSYVGQSDFKYIPVDEDVELNLGPAADVIVKPTLRDFKTDNYKFDPNRNIIGWDEIRTFTIEVKNSRDIRAKVEIQRNFTTPNWDLKTEQKFEKVDLHTVKFTLEMEPRSKQQFEYVLKTSHEVKVWRGGNLIGWWKFDEASGTVAADSSGGGHNGQVEGPEGGPKWSPGGGRLQGCLVFNDDTAVILPQDVLDSVDRQITISVWLKNPFREGANNCVFDTGDGNINVQAIFTSGTGEDMVWRAGNSGDDVLVWDPPGRNTRTLRGWHHYAFVKDELAGQMRIYFDGSPVSSKDRVSSSLANVRNQPFKIGAEVSHINDFVGGMDDFRIYNCALSDEQVRQLYKSALRGQ